jgi:hypothetical protein
MYDLKLSWQLNAIKLSRAASLVRWLKADEISVLRTIPVLILRELKCTSVHHAFLL